MLLVSAMLLPFLPGSHDPLGFTLSVAATGMALGGLLLVPIGAVWLLSARGYGPARVAVGVAALVAAGTTVMTAAVGSLAAAAIFLAACGAWLVHLWRAVRTAQSSGAMLPRSAALALIVVPLAATAARVAFVAPAAQSSRERVIANSAEIIRDIERFRERTGVYPAAISSLWPDYHPGIIGVERYRYEPSGQAYNLYFEHPSTDFATLEIVMYNPRGEQDFSSHAFDLLQLSPEDIRRQRGYFRSEPLAQANWKRFLFD